MAQNWSQRNNERKKLVDVIYLKRKNVILDMSQFFIIFGTMFTLRTIEKRFNKGDIFFISDLNEQSNYEAVRKSVELANNMKSTFI